MNLQESGEMYLETIYVLLKERPNLRSIDVAESMGFSKPSVSRAMNLLKKEELITVSDRGFIKLTEMGRRYACKIYERHMIFSKLLIELGVDEKTATEDACKMEHVISDKSFRAIKKHLKEEGHLENFDNKK